MKIENVQNSFMEVYSNGVLLLSCQFHYTIETCNKCVFWRIKSLLYKCIDLVVEVYEENSGTSFFGDRVGLFLAFSC